MQRQRHFPVHSHLVDRAVACTFQPGLRNAVFSDLSIFDLKAGKLVPMPSDYDEFTERASPDYAGGTEEERRNRDMLRKLMEAEGFSVNANEWWHFDYKDWESYAIYDISFDEAEKAARN